MGMNVANVRPFALVLALASVPSLGVAQPPVPGDANGDGVYSQPDLPGLASCLDGPWAFPPAPEPACLPFDLDGDGRVTLRDLINLHDYYRLQGSQDCIQPSGWRAYAGFAIESGSPQLPHLFADGAAARISVTSSKLCQLNAVDGPTAASLAWVGIAQANQAPLGSAQIGFLTGRSFPLTDAGPPLPPNPSRFHQLYAELIWDNSAVTQDPADATAWTRLWSPFEPRPGPMEFSVRTGQGLQGTALAINLYIFDPIFNEVVAQVTVQCQRQNCAFDMARPPTAATFTTEIFNPGDHFPGTPFSPCVFEHCSVADNLAQQWIPIDLQDPSVEELLIISPLPDDFVRLRRVQPPIPLPADTGKFEVWDTRH